MIDLELTGGILVLAIILSVFLSYFFFTYSFVSLLEAVDEKIGRYSYFAGFMGAVMDRSLSIGGVPGVLARILISKKDHKDRNTVWKVTALHFYLYRMVSLGVLLVSIALSPSIHYDDSTLVKLEKLAALVFPLLSVALILALKKSLHRQVMRAFTASYYMIDKYMGYKLPKIRGFDASSSLSAKLKLKSLAVVSLSVIGDWVFAAMSIIFLFRLVGDAPAFTVALTSFMVGSTAGGFTPIPGGFGVQDGVMLGVFSIYGISFNEALPVILLFRVVFNVIPFAIGFILTHRLYGKDILSKILKFIWSERTK